MEVGRSETEAELVDVIIGAVVRLNCFDGDKLGCVVETPETA